MGNKSKIVFTSAFACVLGMAAIGCNNNSPRTITEYAVSFTSEQLKANTSVTSIKSDQDLSLSLSLTDAAKGKGYRLPDKDYDKDAIKVTSGNAILAIDSDFTFSIDDDVATLNIPHHSYAGDIGISVKGILLYNLSQHLNLVNVVESGENTVVTIGADQKYRAPDFLDAVRVNQKMIDYDYDREEGSRTGTLTFATKDIADARTVDIEGIPVNDDTDTIPVYFYAPETTWGYLLDPTDPTSYFANRPLLANMFVDDKETHIAAPAQDQYVHDELEVSTSGHLDAVIELANYDEVEEVSPEIISEKYQKNYHYSHELPRAIDREGVHKNFKVIGILPGGEEMEIPSNHYEYNPSEDYKSALFFMDHYWLTQYPFARIEIHANIEQVANNVIMNLDPETEYDPDITFDRHCYRYDSEVLGEEDFFGKIGLLAEGRRLPKDYDDDPTVEENSRVTLQMRDDDPNADPIYEFDYRDEYKYKVTDGDVRHEATLAIDRETIPHDWTSDDPTKRPLPYDIVLTVHAVDPFIVVQDGDMQHLDIVPTTPLYQDEDLSVDLFIDRPTYDPATYAPTNKSAYYDYDNTFRIPDEGEEDGLIYVYNQDGEDVYFDYSVEYDLTRGCYVGKVDVPNAAIAQSTEIHIEAYAPRTHFLAPFVAEDDDPITGRPYESDYIGYFLEEAALDGSLYIPVPSDPTDSITANVGLTLAGYNEEKKLTKHSITDVYYEYGGNDEHEEPSEDIWYVDGDEEMSFEVRNSTSVILRQYKDIGTVTAKAPLDTSDPDGNFPAYNEDMLVWIYATPDTLVHDIVVYDDNPRTTPADSHYEITGITFNNAEVREPTTTEPWKWQWVEPITGDNPSITLTIKLKQQYIDEGYSLPVSTDPSVFIYTEELPSSQRYRIGLDEYGFVQWGRTQDNKGFVCNVTVNPTAPYPLSAICGSIEFDCWAPIPPATR